MIEYRNGSDSLHYQSYRAGVEDCPHCDYERRYEERKKFDWFQESAVRAIVFIDSGNWYKKGHAIVVSECPKCFKTSFHHWRLESMRWCDWVDMSKIEAEIKRLTENTQEEWNRSLCRRCSVKKEIEKDCFGYVIDCEGPGGSPEKPWEVDTFRCKKYVPIDPDTCVYCGKRVQDNEQAHDECQKKMDEINRVSYNKWLRDMHRLGWHLDKKEKEEQQ